MTIDKERLSTLLLPDVTLNAFEPHSFSVFSDSAPIYHNDQSVAFYYRVIGNPFYNRLMWGYRISEFDAFTHTALASNADGWVLDAGCGSLSFTAGTYSKYSDRPVVMLDQSIQMLRAAKSKLVTLCAEVPSNIVFLQGDILQLPFKVDTFDTIISLSMLHVLDDAKAMIGELRKILARAGQLYVTSLVLGRPWGDRYLHFLHKSGGVASPRNCDQVLAAFADMDIPTKHEVKGNMMFIHSA